MRTACLLLLVNWCVSAIADEPAAGQSAKQFESVQSLLQMYCADCHSGDDAEAGVDLDLDEVPDVAAAFEDWTTILQKIEEREMPPEDAMQPTDAERATIVKWIDAGLANFDCSKQPVVPRTTVRRLNRAEYNNVVRDLFGVANLRPADKFPVDEVGEGFDNLGSVLSLPPLLMEKYLDAAEQITGQVRGDQQAWQTAFPSLSLDATHSPQQVEQAIRDFAGRAYRRPIDKQELRRLMQLFTFGQQQDLSQPDALLFVTQGILTSPKFLFRLEEDPAGLESEEPIPLDSYAIASRLSFLLWSSLPDEQLRQRAAEGALLDPAHITQQAERMLEDDRSAAFVQNFFGQWLQLRLLSSIVPDPELFPQFDSQLREAMKQETLLFVEDLVKNDGSILSILDADFTFLNEPLAKHYGVAGVEGESFQRVSLQDDRRGGVLTQASILTLTSNPTRTSPVKRGKWILENILGTPPSASTSECSRAGRRR